MSTELVKAAPMNVATIMTGEVHTGTIDVSVSGDNPTEIAHGHAQLTAWCERKVATEKAEHAELHAAYQHAVKSKWKVSTLKLAADRAAGRVRYYEKMLAAFRAGFVLVPNFPLTIFAIRTQQRKPTHMVSYSQWESFTQKSDKSPVGEGNYHAPIPTVYTEERNVPKKDGGTETKIEYSPSDEWEGIDFPMSMAKPHIMELVDRAMALKIFDEIGILPEQRAKGDPVIAGVIKMPKAGYSERACTFLLAWHVDTRTL